MTLDDELLLAEAAARGAEFMDAIDANVTDDAELWFWVVNPDTLDMGQDYGACGGCVIVQHDPRSEYAPDRYDLLTPDEVRLGFDLESSMGTDLDSDSAYAALTARWVEEIDDRRAAWFDRHPEAVLAT